MAKEIVLAVALLAAAVSAQFNYCLRTTADITNWDQCNSNLLGQHKSISVCYFHTVTSKYVYRYDYYVCSKTTVGTTTYFILNPANCSGTQSPIANGAFYDVFNRYDESSKTCTLTPPPPPTQAPTTVAPTTAAPTTAAPTTAAPTTAAPTTAAPTTAAPTTAAPTTAAPTTAAPTTAAPTTAAPTTAAPTTAAPTTAAPTTAAPTTAAPTTAAPTTAAPTTAAPTAASTSTVASSPIAGR